VEEPQQQSIPNNDTWAGDPKTQDLIILITSLWGTNKEKLLQKDLSVFRRHHGQELQAQHPPRQVYHGLHSAQLAACLSTRTKAACGGAESQHKPKWDL
jgi:hypothetical protein